MKKSTDKDVLRKSAELEGKGDRKVASFADFRRKFYQYQRAKTGGQIHPKPVCRPYVEVFHQPQRDRKS